MLNSRHIKRIFSRFVTRRPVSAVYSGGIYFLIHTLLSSPDFTFRGAPEPEYSGGTYGISGCVHYSHPHAHPRGGPPARNYVFHFSHSIFVPVRTVLSSVACIYLDTKATCSTQISETCRAGRGTSTCGLRTRGTRDVRSASPLARGVRDVSGSVEYD